MALSKNTYCSYCGNIYVGSMWPRYCIKCNEITWRNPLPATVILAETLTDNEKESGLVLVRRSIEPHIGEWCLPGGYLDVGETWQEGASRELREETGIYVTGLSAQLVDVISSSSDNVLIIFCSMKLWESAIPTFVPNEEVSEIMVAKAPMELAFPSHTEMMRKFFEKQHK